MATKIAPDFDYTDAELLALVKEAIAVVTKYGKSYVIGGRTFTCENVSDLYDLLGELERRISRRYGNRVTVRYGRIGTEGQTQTKAFDAAGSAGRHAQQQVDSKVRKGYAECAAA